jgi:hypothetical protein
MEAILERKGQEHPMEKRQDYCTPGGLTWGKAIIEAISGCFS